MKKSSPRNTKSASSELVNNNQDLGKKFIINILKNSFYIENNMFGNRKTS